MTDKLKQIIKEEMEKLPQENQEAINALDWAKITEEVGEEYFLDENQVNNLEVETFLVLVGMTDLEFYAINVENQVETIKDDAEKIAEEITQKIFTPIKDILMENIKKNGKSENANAEQNLNFILSDGDYSSFIEERSNEINNE